MLVRGLQAKLLCLSMVLLLRCSSSAAPILRRSLTRFSISATFWLASVANRRRSMMTESAPLHMTHTLPSGKRTMMDIFLRALVNSITSPDINQRSLKDLLETDPNLDLQRNSGETALYITARSGDIELVELLLSSSAAPNQPENIKRWTPLIIASIEGHATVVELLLEAGADKQQKDCRGWTSSDHAAYRGHMEICKILGEWTSCSAPYSLPSSPPYRIQPFREFARSRNDNVIFVNMEPS